MESCNTCKHKSVCEGSNTKDNYFNWCWCYQKEDNNEVIK